MHCRWRLLRGRGWRIVWRGYRLWFLLRYDCRPDRGRPQEVDARDHPRRGGMKGHPQVIALLNDVLTAELTAINQYFIHARMCENWGYERLWKKLRHESIDEMKHADELIKRILFLEGVPNLQKLNKVNVGQTVPEQLQLDLAVEKD